MRENNRKSIEKCRKKLPQFTTMNVIDGQAGLMIYSSLIFYSLTIDNILNIIILLILAGVSIATLTGDNGLLTRTNDAKVETALGSVKEALKLEQGEKRIEDKELTPEILLAEGKVTRTVQQKEDEKYYMYYAIKEKAFEGMQGLGKGNLSELKDVFLIDDNLNVKYIASNGKEYGDNIEEKILDDETEIRFSNKAFSEYISKISGIKEEDMKFKWMKNLTKLTIDDSFIESLEDLVFFPNLEELTLKNLKLENLNGIEKCNRLNELSIMGSIVKDRNKIAELSNLETYNDYEKDLTESKIKCLKNNDNIKIIRFYNYNDSNIEILGTIKNLQELLLQNTKILDLGDLGNLFNLKSLTIYNSNLTKIEGIENLQKLESISLTDANISDLTPLSSNTALKAIDLRKNPIDAERANYQGERLIKLNQISKILDNGGTINLDSDKLKLFSNYTKLILSSQHLNTLDILEGMTDLKDLNLAYNNLTLTDKKTIEILKSMKNLESLNLIGNPITDIKFMNEMTSLKTLTFGKNYNINLKDIEDIISNINLNIISWNSLENCDSEKITKLSSQWSTMDEIPNLSKFENLIEIKFDHITLNNKQSLKNIENILSVERLTMSSMELHNNMFDFEKLDNLEYVNLSGNNLWDEELENLKELKNNKNLTIDLSNNSIIDATALLELNPGTKINLSGNVNLSQDSKDKLKSRFGRNVTF